MELFFLCTIIMAGVSFLSIALSQPPVQLSINNESDGLALSTEHSLQEAASNATTVTEYAQMRELAGLSY